MTDDEIKGYVLARFTPKAGTTARVGDIATVAPTTTRIGVVTRSTATGEEYEIPFDDIRDTRDATLDDNITRWIIDADKPPGLLIYKFTAIGSLRGEPRAHGTKVDGHISYVLNRKSVASEPRDAIVSLMERIAVNRPSHQVHDQHGRRLQVVRENPDDDGSSRYIKVYRQVPLPLSVVGYFDDLEVGVTDALQVGINVDAQGLVTFRR